MEDYWTVDSLKEYLDSNLENVHGEIKLRISELHREHDKFESTVKDALVKQNDFRGSLGDLGRTMATRRELETLDEKYSLRTGRTESLQAKIIGALIFISAIMMPAVVLITFFVSH